MLSGHHTTPLGFGSRAYSAAAPSADTTRISSVPASLMVVIYSLSQAWSTVFLSHALALACMQSKPLSHSEQNVVDEIGYHSKHAVDTEKNSVVCVAMLSRSSKVTLMVATQPRSIS